MGQTINTQGRYYSLAKRQDRRFIAIVSSGGKGSGRRARAEDVRFEAEIAGGALRRDRNS